MALSAMPLCSISMNAADDGSICFSLGHFLGFTDIMMSFVAILLVPRHGSLTHYIELREAGKINRIPRRNMYAVFSVETPIITNSIFVRLVINAVNAGFPSPTSCVPMVLR